MAYRRRSNIAYISGGDSPDLEVVRSHENIGDTLTNVAQNPLVEVLGLGVGNTVLDSSVDQTFQTGDLILLGQHGDIVLERVRDPEALVADV